MALRDIEKNAGVAVMILLLSVWSLLGENSCDDAEYFITGQCCPMCAPGDRVNQHCDDKTGTSCIPCTQGTYMDHPNGLTECFKCQLCDLGLGLQEVKKCTYTSNAVCDCRGGYFCVELKGEGCGVCRKHSVSKPGYRVKENGTTRSDTVIEACPLGTFSAEEMSEKCIEWKDCAKLGLLEIEPGTSTKDAVCKEKSYRHRWVISLAFISAPLILLLLTLHFQGFVKVRTLGDVPIENNAPLPFDASSSENRMSESCDNQGKSEVSKQPVESETRKNNCKSTLPIQESCGLT
uniref:TNFRSF14 n=3 Tax=Protopterus TaxID=7885 RepID=A0A6B9D8T7_PRODO|nr:TNFRSF14 [Protopterus dolloi]